MRGRIVHMSVNILFLLFFVKFILFFLLLTNMIHFFYLVFLVLGWGCILEGIWVEWGYA